jgi:hypothetical protein
MLVGKAGAYPFEKLFGCATLGKASDLAHKLWTSLERLARQKLSKKILKLRTNKVL